MASGRVGVRRRWLLRWGQLRHRLLTAVIPHSKTVAFLSRLALSSSSLPLPPPSLLRGPGRDGAGARETQPKRYKEITDRSLVM